MKSQTINQKIEIHASAEQVWEILWNRNNYKKWAAAFMQGSRYVGDLKPGGRIQFLDANENGMESDVESVTRNQEITFHHLFEVEGGKQGRTLGDLRERYELTERDGVTTLMVSSDMPEEYFEEMNSAMTEALQIVKQLAEE